MVSIIVGVQQGMIGSGMTTTVDASYIADNVIMLRYFEAQGEVRQAISVFKKRGSEHERTIRRFQIGSGGIEVGPVLKDFHGILTGVPTYDGPGAGRSARLSAMETRILIYAPDRPGRPAGGQGAGDGVDRQPCLPHAGRAGGATGAGCGRRADGGGSAGAGRLQAAAGMRRAHQPDWSDLPIILLTHRGADSSAVRQAVAGLGNLSLMERPMRSLALITALHATLRATQKAVPGARGGAAQG